MLKTWAKLNNTEKFIIIIIAVALITIASVIDNNIFNSIITVSFFASIIWMGIEFSIEEDKKLKRHDGSNHIKLEKPEFDFKLNIDSPYVTSSTGDKVLLKDDYVYINKGKSSKIANCIANNTWEAIDTVDLKIPLDVITVINYKDSGMYKGYLEFIYPGFNVRPRDIIKHLQENIVTFNTKEESEIFFSFKEIVEERIKELKNQNKNNNNLSVADEIKKLADLKNQGILTEEEFLLQKNKLMGL